LRGGLVTDIRSLTGLPTTIWRRELDVTILVAGAARMADESAAQPEARFAGSSVNGAPQVTALYGGAAEDGRAKIPYEWLEFYDWGIRFRGRGARRESAWYFHKVPESKHAKNRVHIDLVDLDLSAIDELVRLGATVVENHTELPGHPWTVLQGIEGNEICVAAKSFTGWD
jgi:glyoxalase superfamily protein